MEMLLTCILLVDVVEKWKKNSKYRSHRRALATYVSVSVVFISMHARIFILYLNDAGIIICLKIHFFVNIASTNMHSLIILIITLPL